MTSNASPLSWPFRSFSACSARLPLWLGVILSMAAIGYEAQAQMVCQPYWTAAYKCMEHCGPCPSSGNGGGGGNVNWRQIQQQQAQQAAVAAAQARYQAALAVEKEAEAKNTAGAAAAAEEAAKAYADFVHQRDLLATMMRGDESAPSGLRGDDTGSSGLKDGCSGSSCGNPAEGEALRQARVAVAGDASADCILDGRAGCKDPVPLVKFSPTAPPLPPDAAKFIESIPKSLRDKPGVKRDIDMYEHFASVRAEAQNQMIADVAVAKAHPDDETDRLKVMEDSGHLKAASDDEQKVKQRISMSIGLIPQSKMASGTGTQGTAAGNTSSQGAATNNTSGK